MLKPFITFTNTDATRLFNNAGTKNIVIRYLHDNGLIQRIDDLFLSSIPSKNKSKGEVGYVKQFPLSSSASEAAAFEIKLREKVGITLDDYNHRVIGDLGSLTLPAMVNNVFNTANSSWLLNRLWYDKLQDGRVGIYFRNKVVCPNENMSRIPPTIAAVSSDDGKMTFRLRMSPALSSTLSHLVHDPFDRPRSKLTSSQRTKKELLRLDGKRKEGPGAELPAKRQRKPKRFADDG
jgi:hypothetical protein